MAIILKKHKWSDKNMVLAYRDEARNAVILTLKTSVDQVNLSESDIASLAISMGLKISL